MMSIITFFWIISTFPIILDIQTILTSLFNLMTRLAIPSIHSDDHFGHPDDYSVHSEDTILITPVKSCCHTQSKSQIRLRLIFNIAILTITYNL